MHLVSVNKAWEKKRRFWKKYINFSLFIPKLPSLRWGVTKFTISCLLILKMLHYKFCQYWPSSFSSPVRRRCRCCKLFTFSSSSPELLDQFQSNLAQNILRSWLFCILFWFRWWSFSDKSKYRFDKSTTDNFYVWLCHNQLNVVVLYEITTTQLSQYYEQMDYVLNWHPLFGFNSHPVVCVLGG